MRKRLLLLSILLSCATVFAQQKEFVFKNFTQEEGLPSNEAYYIFEDSRHFLWIATDLGVARYDGNKFQVFSLPDNVVFKIREDHKGRIWFFTHKGLLAYFKNEKIYPYKYNTEITNRIDKIHIIDCMVDDSDNIFLNSYLDSNFVISANGSIRAFNHTSGNISDPEFSIDYIEKSTCFAKVERSSTTKNIELLKIKVTRKKQVQEYQVKASPGIFAHYGSIADNGKDIYFFAGRSVIKLPEYGQPVVKEMPAKIISIGLFRNNLLVGISKNGAALLDANTLEKSGDTILPNKSVTCITPDYEGGLWLSTLENGAYYIKSSFIQHLADKSLSDVHVSRMLNVNDQYLVYAKSTGLYKCDKNENSLFYKYNNFTAIDIFGGYSNNLYVFGSVPAGLVVNTIDLPDFKKLFLFDCPSEHIRLSKDSFIVSTPFTVIYLSFRGATKASAEADPRFPYKWSNHRLLSKQGKIFRDAENNIWAGCNDGLYVSGKAKDTLLKFAHASALLNRGISCIRQMDNGMIVAGIRSSGIALVKDTGLVGTITETEGLASNKVRFLLPYKNQLWSATAKGISVIIFTSYNPLTYKIINIGKSDGFYNLTINQLVKYQNSIAAATNNGIYFINDPGTFLQPPNTPLPFYITNIITYKGDTNYVNNISLPFLNNRIVIKYTAITFKSYETVKYFYRFDKDDTTWQSTINTERLIENLSPGTYTLQLKAGIPEQERYSDIITITINIEKPWWQNNWFRLLVLVIAAAAIYYFVSARVKKVKGEERKKTALNAKLAELEQTALRSRMNPHFIFNCLTSIQQLIISGNKVDANEYLVKFSRLIRKTLEMSAHPFISISEEKEYLEEYLFLEQLRLSGKFDYSITADPSINIEQTFIPNMMLQPIVENCVRHGIKSLEGRHGSITVHFDKGKNVLTCTVTDNGVGRNGISSFDEKAFSKHRSYGMDIVRKRLETFAEFNAGESGIEIKDLFDTGRQPAGTQVILHLPYKNNL